MYTNKKISSLLVLTLLVGCARASQNTYTENDVGKNINVQFGRIVQIRPVNIKGNNTGVGALAGASAGAVGGSYVGNGNVGASLLGIIGGALIGGLSGAGAEQLLQNHKGMEYTIFLNIPSGDTKKPHPIRSIVQNVASDDKPLFPGQCVEVQTSSNYQRVLPTSSGYLCDGEDLVRKRMEKIGKLDKWLKDTETDNTVVE